MSDVEAQIREWELQSGPPRPDERGLSELSRKIIAAAAEPDATPSSIARQLKTTTGHVSKALRLAGIDIVSGRRPRSKNPELAFYRNPRPARTSRPCICCGHRFWSGGTHNRMCEPCRNLPTA